MSIDPANRLLVGRNGLGQLSIALPRAWLSREDALLHAAWLVELAEDYPDEFEKYREAVRRSSG